MQSRSLPPQASVVGHGAMRQADFVGRHTSLWRFLMAFLISAMACGTVAKDYSSGSKSLRFTCVDDNRWVNGTRLELRGNPDKGGAGGALA